MPALFENRHDCRERIKQVAMKLSLWMFLRALKHNKKRGLIKDKCVCCSRLAALQEM